MILLSLVLVIASAVTLGFGVFSTSDELVWVSLAAGLGAVALVTGSVVRRRRTLGPDATIGEVTGPESAGAAAIGGAPPGPRLPGSAIPGPAPSSAAPRPAVPDTGAGTQSWPWNTAAPTGPPGWTGAVPDVRPPPPVEPPPAPPVEPPPGRPVEPPGARRPPAVPEPAVEEGMETVPVRDALRVAQLADEVLVADGQPRYHLSGCVLLEGVLPLPLAVSAARRAGFTPCAVCTPDRVLLARARDRAAERANGDR